MGKADFSHLASRNIIIIMFLVLIIFNQPPEGGGHCQNLCIIFLNWQPPLSLNYQKTRNPININRVRILVPLFLGRLLLNATLMGKKVTLARTAFLARNAQSLSLLPEGLAGDP